MSGSLSNALRPRLGGGLGENGLHKSKSRRSTRPRDGDWSDGLSNALRPRLGGGLGENGLHKSKSRRSTRPRDGDWSGMEGICSE
jgi:hypothetical protein